MWAVKVQYFQGSTEIYYFVSKDNAATLYNNYCRSRAYETLYIESLEVYEIVPSDMNLKELLFGDI